MQDYEYKKALLYKLPGKNYKYSIEEMAELYNVYARKGWAPILRQRNSKSTYMNTRRVLYLAVGFFPIFFISWLCIYSAAGGSSVIDPVQTEPSISTGGIAMAAFILTILAILGIVGIISFFADMGEDGKDRDAQEIIEKELNAHTQILTAMQHDNQLLQEELNYYKEKCKRLSRGKKSKKQLIEYDEKEEEEL